MTYGVPKYRQKIKNTLAVSTVKLLLNQFKRCMKSFLALKKDKIHILKQV